MSTGPAADAVAARPMPVGRFRRADRLLHKTDFDAVFRRGRRAQAAHLQAVAAPARAAGPRPRLGLAIARAAGSAPLRARLRRLLREAFRAVRSELQAPADLVVSVRQPWPDADLAAVHAELLAVTRRLRLLA